VLRKRQDEGPYLLDDPSQRSTTPPLAPPTQGAGLGFGSITFAVPRYVKRGGEGHQSFHRPGGSCEDKPTLFRSDMCDPRIQLHVAFRTKCDSRSPDIVSGRTSNWITLEKAIRKPANVICLMPGMIACMMAMRQQINGQRWCVDRHAFRRSAQLSTVRM